MGTGFGIYETLQQKLIDTLESTGTSMQTKEAEQVWFKKKTQCTWLDQVMTGAMAAIFKYLPRIASLGVQKDKQSVV